MIQKHMAQLADFHDKTAIFKKENFIVHSSPKEQALCELPIFPASPDTLPCSQSLPAQA